MLALIFIFIQLFFVLFIFYLGISFITGAPFVPSTNDTARSMIALARIKPGMKVYDLGSGEGRLLALAARAGALATGLEINPILVLFTKLKFLFSPYRSKIRVRWQNFWKADISDADVIFVYLLPWRMEKLENQLKLRVKPGTIVVSNSFIFPHLKKIREDRTNHVFVFEV